MKFVRWLAALFLITVVTSTIAQEDHSLTRETGPWNFRNYSVAAHFSGKPAKPLLVTARERKFRSAIQAQASKGPNFAGDFTLVHWGCGSPCLSFMIVNAVSGAIYDFKEPVGCGDKNGMYAAVDFKLNSRLVITTGFSEKLGCGTNFYEWNGKKLTLIQYEQWSSRTD